MGMIGAGDVPRDSAYSEGMRMPAMLDMGYMTLEGAAKLIGDGWARGDMAYDDEGAPLGAEDENAAHFCAEGAIRRAWLNIAGAAVPRCDEEMDGGDLDAWRAFRAFYKAIYGRAPVGSLMAVCEAISSWNDNPYRERSEVLAAFDRAKAIIAGGEVGA